MTPHTRVELLFIRQPEKQTVMSFCGVTGRSGHVDRTLRSVQPAHQCLSVDRTLTGSITTDRTRPVALNPHWMLTVLDRTLARVHPVLTGRWQLPVTL